MRIRNALLPSCALTLAVLLLAPERGRGFDVTGDSLGLDQRDVRLHNTFADLGANDNTTFEPQFPGFFGADMAVWKGVVEWGSEPHGDGSGDPTQLNLGDGGANFDGSWQGSATAAGGPNDNVISVMPACVGSILAFTEIGTSDGWRIFFCDDFLWHDGPDAIPVISGNFDIQSLAAHEYGHALGLGHSSDTTATMRPSTPVGDLAQRSIEADDVSGVQSIYGAASATKPRIDSISGSSMLTIAGANFDATDNEVWFTQGTPGGNGDPVLVGGVPSSASGTMLTVDFPAAAGPGDVLVRTPGVSNDRLSNAHPFNPTPDPPVTYCSGKVNSDFCVPFVTTQGVPSASSTDPFQIRGNDVIDNQWGLLIYGLSGRGNIPYHNAKICVKAPLVRLMRSRNSGDDGSPSCAGMFKVNFNQRIQSGLDPLLVPGTRVNAQWVYRDPGIDSFNDGLTNAVEFLISP